MYRSLEECKGIYWNVSEYIGMYRNILECIRIYWNESEYNRMYNKVSEYIKWIRMQSNITE